MTPLRPTVRVRLTALYALLFGASAALLMALSWWLVSRQLHRTLPESFAQEAVSDLGAQYALAFAGTFVIAVALGWTVAGRALAPLTRITRTARSVSEEALDQRIGLRGPDDELRELADTFDGMLDRLSEAFDAQRRFIANASHELRSPLTVIRSEAEVALANPRPDLEELRASAEAAVEATKRTEALLDGLLALARTHRGKVRREEVDLAAAARSAAALTASEASAADVRVRLAIAPTAASGDRRLLERLAVNLVENAVRHNVEGGWVEVVTERRDGTAVMRVSNTGRQLAPDSVDRLAEPFERLGRHGRGAGLGLSIVRAVTDAHGGELHLAARGDGGLVAEVRLPAYSATVGGGAGAQLRRSASEGP